MTRTILVPVDGSEKDARALAVAVDLADLANASVLVTRVRSQDDERLRPQSTGDPLDAMRATTEVVARRVRHGLTCEVLSADDVPNAILARADDAEAMAVVMATRAPQAIDRAVHGSVADRVVREGTRPVVLVPPRADFMAGRDVRLRHGLLPVDGSAASLSVLDHLLALPNARELRLLLLQVVPPEPNHEAAVRAEEALATIVEGLGQRGVTAEARVVEARNPAEIVVDAVRQELTDFIAMNTRGASGIARTVFGSVATAVVRSSEVPVFLITPNVLQPSPPLSP